MHNFFSDKLGVSGDELRLSPDESKHLFKTLRTVKGEMIGIIDGRGAYAEAELIDNRRIVIRRV
ncbi:MAG: hypothetical protein PHV59_12165, partial [Victivallales bacterium]|nr:hypothetical protein [Victivallales bacterium]